MEKGVEEELAGCELLAQPYEVHRQGDPIQVPALDWLQSRREPELGFVQQFVLSIKNCTSSERSRHGC